MTIRNIMIALGFEVDDKSVSNAEKTIDGLKSMAAKALGALGVAFSLQSLNEIAEEYGAINNQIRSATEGMGEQAEIQQKILKAANNSRTAYGDTAKFVGNLVQSSSDLFGSVDEAAQYAELTNKLFRSAGKSSEQVAQMQEALNQSFARGVVDTETMSRLLEESPEAIKLLEKEVGASKEQFEEMASAGQITVADLKNAIVNNADEINRAFNNVDMTVSDALLNIRNQWGVWVAKINDQYKITDRLSRLLVTIFGKLMNWLDKAVAFVDKLADKLGGFENLLKLIAIAAGSIWLGLNAGKIMGFLGKIPGMLKGITSVLNPIHLKTMALVAVIALIALAIDDLIAFMNGDASIIGVFFEKNGHRLRCSQGENRGLYQWSQRIAGEADRLTRKRIFSGQGFPRQHLVTEWGQDKKYHRRSYRDYRKDHHHSGKSILGGQRISRELLGGKRGSHPVRYRQFCRWNFRSPFWLD